LSLEVLSCFDRYNFAYSACDFGGILRAARKGSIMLHNEDIVEEVSTKRQGKIDSIGSSIVNGQETPNQWGVRFSDGKEPLLTFFKNEEELRLIRCPHTGNDSDPGFIPSRSIMEP